MNKTRCFRRKNKKVLREGWSLIMSSTLFPSQYLYRLINCLLSRLVLTEAWSLIMSSALFPSQYLYRLTNSLLSRFVLTEAWSLIMSSTLFPSQNLYRLINCLLSRLRFKRGGHLSRVPFFFLADACTDSSTV